MHNQNETVDHPGNVTYAAPVDGLVPYITGIQALCVTRKASVAGDGEAVDRDGRVTLDHDVDSLAPTFAALREQHRQRQYLHRAEKSLTLAMKAQCRGLTGGSKREADILFAAAVDGKGEHPLAAEALIICIPFIEARKIIHVRRMDKEKQLLRLGQALAPAMEWVKSVRGFGMLNYAMIIAETGDLNNYANPAKLWTRMGVGNRPDGTRQRRVKGDEAIEHRYSPSRASISWNLGQCVFKAQGSDGPYRQLYDARKAYQIERDGTDKLAHKRALRYMVKRLLKHLWQAWRAQPLTDDLIIRVTQSSNVVGNSEIVDRGPLDTQKENVNDLADPLTDDLTPNVIQEGNVVGDSEIVDHGFCCTQDTNVNDLADLLFDDHVIGYSGAADLGGHVTQL